jgi:hypothetical protein
LELTRTVAPRVEFDAVLTSAVEEPPALCPDAGLLGAVGLLLALFELPPQALNSSEAAIAPGMRNFCETRTVTLLFGICSRFWTTVAKDAANARLLPALPSRESFAATPWRGRWASFKRQQTSSADNA